MDRFLIGCILIGCLVVAALLGLARLVMSPNDWLMMVAMLASLAGLVGAAFGIGAGVGWILGTLDRAAKGAAARWEMAVVRSAAGVAVTAPAVVFTLLGTGALGGQPPDLLLDGTERLGSALMLGLTYGAISGMLLWGFWGMVATDMNGAIGALIVGAIVGGLLGGLLGCLARLLALLLPVPAALAVFGGLMGASTAWSVALLRRYAGSQAAPAATVPARPEHFAAFVTALDEQGVGEFAARLNRMSPQERREFESRITSADPEEQRRIAEEFNRPAAPEDAAMTPEQRSE